MLIFKLISVFHQYFIRESITSFLSIKLMLIAATQLFIINAIKS